MNRSLIQAIEGALDRALRFKRRKDVLLIAYNEIMFQFAYPIYRTLDDDTRIRFWFCAASPAFEPTLRRLKGKLRLRTIPRRWATLVKWDLILYPDHREGFRPECPKIYVGHGIHAGKLVKGTPYIFGPRSLDASGRIIYQKIFCQSEAVARQVEAFRPEFLSCVRVVGCLRADLLWEQHVDRIGFLRSMGLDADRRTVFFCSTWGPNSLVQSAGEALIREINLLGRDCNIILALHLMNYKDLPDNRVKVRELLQGVEAPRFHLASPDEDGGLSLLPLADILVTDTTSFGFFFPHYERPIIFYDIADNKYDPVGMLADLRRTAYVIREFRDLETHIEQCVAAFRPEVMRELSLRMVSHQGKSVERHREEILDSLGLEPQTEQ
jgi:hypothetical protein